MTEELFDLADKYEAMLAEGLRVSGEDWAYFMRGRVNDLKGRLPNGWQPQRILDFGCGVGLTTQHFAHEFPRAEIVGVDTSKMALRRAAESNSSRRVTFMPLSDLGPTGDFDLCYTNGVFHHIEPASRPIALKTVELALSPAGYFALFENNPWNPGTRLVMRRIPFDRDAKTLSVPTALRLFHGSTGWQVMSVRSLFYFPRILSRLRFCEQWLACLPLGAQYYVLARRI